MGIWVVSNFLYFKNSATFIPVHESIFTSPHLWWLSKSRILELKSWGSSVSYIFKAFASYCPVAFWAGITNMQFYQEFILTGKTWYTISNYFSLLNVKWGCFHSAYCTTIFRDVSLYLITSFLLEYWSSSSSSFELKEEDIFFVS